MWGVLVGPCGFGVAADSGYLMISGNNSATIISDMAHIMGLHQKVSAALFGLQMAGS